MTLSWRSVSETAAADLPDRDLEQVYRQVLKLQRLQPDGMKAAIEQHRQISKEASPREATPERQRPEEDPGQRGSASSSSDNPLMRIATSDMITAKSDAKLSATKFQTINAGKSRLAHIANLAPQLRAKIGPNMLDAFSDILLVPQLEVEASTDYRRVEAVTSIYQQFPFLEADLARSLRRQVDDPKFIYLWLGSNKAQRYGGMMQMRMCGSSMLDPLYEAKPVARVTKGFRYLRVSSTNNQ